MSDDANIISTGQPALSVNIVTRRSAWAAEAIERGRLPLDQGRAAMDLVHAVRALQTASAVEPRET